MDRPTKPWVSGKGTRPGVFEGGGCRWRRVLFRPTCRRVPAIRQGLPQCLATPRWCHPPPARRRLPQSMTTVTAPTRTRWFRGRGLAAVAPRNAKGPVGYTGPVRGTSWRGVQLAGPATVSRGLTSRFRLAGPCRFRQDRHQNYRSFPGRNQGTLGRVARWGRRGGGRDQPPQPQYVQDAVLDRL